MGVCTNMQTFANNVKSTGYDASVDQATQTTIYQQVVKIGRTGTGLPVTVQPAH